MEKKMYAMPSTIVVKAECQSILAGSGDSDDPSVKGEIEGDDSGLGYGGGTKPGESYYPD